jgi:REP element-mobilizing transposase RayT
MARPLRLEFAGALYHVTSRGDRREMIFESDDDRRAFLSVFGKVCETFNWECHAYCLMGNHYHLLIETPWSGQALCDNPVKLLFSVQQRLLRNPFG